LALIAATVRIATQERNHPQRVNSAKEARMATPVPDHLLQMPYLFHSELQWHQRRYGMNGCDYDYTSGRHAGIDGVVDAKSYVPGMHSRAGLGATASKANSAAAKNINRTGDGAC